jgi:hypothetical protein
MRAERMKIALVFAGDTRASDALAPYRSEAFIGALEAEGLEPIVIDIEQPRRAGLAPIAYGGAPRAYRNPVERLPAILHQEAPQFVQTFGWVSELGRLWTQAAKSARPLVHFVSSGGPVEDERELGFAWRRIRPGLRSLAGWSARLASRHVDGLIGSNRTDIAQHVALGFFPRAKFSAVVPPPVASRSATASIDSDAGIPTFGVYDPAGTAASLKFLLRAVALTGHPEFFRVAIAPARLRALAPAGPHNVTFIDAASAQEFMRGIDVLVLPYGEDRMVGSVVAALDARKIVIVPDGGLAAELIEYGRHGMLYAAGSAYHLASAINIMSQAWRNRPFNFAGVDRPLSRVEPAAVASRFAAAYSRLAVA